MSEDRLGKGLHVTVQAVHGKPFPTQYFCTRTTDQQIAWAAFRDYQRDIFYQGRMMDAFTHAVDLSDRARVNGWGRAYEPFVTTEQFWSHVEQAWGMYEYLCSTVPRPGLSAWMSDFRAKQQREMIAEVRKIREGFRAAMTRADRTIDHFTDVENNIPEGRYQLGLWAAYDDAGKHLDYLLRDWQR